MEFGIPVDGKRLHGVNKLKSNRDWIRGLNWLYFIFLFFITVMLHGQGEAANWYFGNSAGANFTTNSATGLSDGKLITNEGCASISNNKGELLFYTDGVSVWDKNHNRMPNGQDLMGGRSSTQSAIIVPKPNSDSIYFIFTVIDGGKTQGLRYSEVDLTLNGGNGDVTANKNVLLVAPCAEKISAIQHANGTDYWVASHLWNSSEFALFKITSTGVELSPAITAIGSFHGGDNFNGIGYMKFSPNGKKLAVARWNTNSLVEVFDFDSSTGALSNPITLNGIFGVEYENGAYAVEFSPNSEVLYVSEIDLGNYTSRLHQFDIRVHTKAAIVNSGTLLYEGRNLIAALQLALDGKIYLCRTFSSFLDAIENPNSFGTASNYLSEALNLAGKRNVYGLPTFIQSLFVAQIEVENLCISGASQFNIETEEPIVDVFWDFGDGKTSNQTEPSHNFNSVGEHVIKAKINTGFSIFNVTKYITIENPSITETVNVEVDDWTANSNSVFINVTGTDDYEYSIDGGKNYQDSSTFYNVKPGDYLVNVRISSGCVIYSEDVYILFYPKFFTPNNDGFNDYWKVNFSETEPHIKIHIFDRYGKLLKELHALSRGWDGTFNGQLMPTSDYWFVIYRPQKSSQYRGHFTLKR